MAIGLTFSVHMVGQRAMAPIGRGQVNARCIGNCQTHKDGQSEVLIVFSANAGPLAGQWWASDVIKI